MARTASAIQIIRAYDLDPSVQGYRVLVDRVWPRGVKKETLALDQWAKELAPSAELRKWFNHDPAKWEEFQRKYAAELDEKSDQRRDLLAKAGDRPILLVYSAKDEEHNQAVVLRSVLEKDRRR